MTRGILAIALAVSTALVAPAAPAPASPYVVYEVVRVRAGGHPTFAVDVTAAVANDTGVITMMMLRPGKKGGYDVLGLAVDELDADEGVRTYGWPAGVPTCVNGCGATKTWHPTLSVGFQPRAGDRVLVAGPRGQTTVTVSNPNWRARETPAVGFRTVMADHATATAVEADGYVVEHFTSASAPGGPYGSVAMAQLPCRLAGAGSATFANDADGPGWSMPCAPVVFGDLAFAETHAGRRWTLDGSVFGVTAGRLRLLVFDFPKPR